MFLTISGTQYELRFGFKFLKTLDELTAGRGRTPGLTPLDEAVLQLGTGDITMVPLVAMAALAHHATMPAADAIELALEELAETLQGGETICSVFIGALKKAPLHTESVTRMAEIAAKMAMKQNQMIEKSMSELDAGSSPAAEATTTIEPIPTPSDISE